MKTDKKSLVPLFTFPPPLLAALFLLAGCHYKALQGMVWAIGVGHRARWRSPMFQTPWHAHTLTLAHFAQSPVPHKHTHARAQGNTHIHSYTCAQTLLYCITHTHTHIHGFTPRWQTLCGRHAHKIRKGNMHTNMHTSARTHHTCTQGLGGTQARIVRVQKSYSVGN